MIGHQEVVRLGERVPLLPSRKGSGMLRPPGPLPPLDCTWLLLAEAMPKADNRPSAVIVDQLIFFYKWQWVKKNENLDLAQKGFIYKNVQK